MIIKNLPDGTPYCEIPLTKGQVAFVSPEDYAELSQYSWHAYFDTVRSLYIARRAALKDEREGKKARTILMHRQIMKTPKGLTVDHLDRTPLNNTRKNLRNCTYAINMLNKAKYKTTNKYRGAVWHSRDLSWTSVIRVNRKIIHLGYCKTEKEAALRYNEAAIKYHGADAQLNVFEEDCLTPPQISDLVCTP